jgi:hypothetical protein
MEDVLEVYCGEYDDKHPLICMDEASKQLVEEVRAPIPTQPGEPEKLVLSLSKHMTRNTNAMGFAVFLCFLNPWQGSVL